MRRLQALAALIFPLQCLAATINVPAEQPTISAAVASAADADTVAVSCGTYTEPNLKVLRSITIRSDTGDPTCVTVDVAGTLLECSDDHVVHLEGLTFTGGSTSAAATVVIAGSIGNGLVSASDCTWQNNPYRALDTRGNVSLSGCTFRGNGSTTGGRAGAVEIRGSSAKTVSITTSTFSDNIAGVGSGGALATVFFGGSFVLDDCTFTNNVAGRLGGAVSIPNETVRVLTNCRFVGNSATKGGGAIDASGTQLTLTNCHFKGNQTATDGGAIHIEQPNTTPPTLTLSGCTFQGNEADRRGGAVNVLHAASVSATDCSFLGNRAGRGGAAYVGLTSGSVKVTACLFRTNAAVEGGALATEGPDVVLTRSTLFRNTADDGGGIHSLSTNLLISESTLVENGGRLSAGGIASYGLGPGTSLVLSHSVIAFSTAGAAVVRGPGGLAPRVTCSVAFGNAGGDWTAGLSGFEGVSNNFSADPLFCSRLTGDLSLSSDSPCSATNSPCGHQIGASGASCVPVALDAVSWGQVKAGYRD